MYLKTLYLRNFRSYKEAEISFDPNLNIICGKNAVGKTNLLEAIYLIATGRSFRTQVLKELIRDGELFFFLEAQILKDGVIQTVQISFDGEQKRLILDANTFSHFQPLLGLLPMVLSTPHDIELITGSPEKRRRFLNLHLAQSDPLYVHHLTRFWRAMKQRNCQLKARQVLGIEFWEMEMARSAEYITKARSDMIDQLKIEELCSEKHQLILEPSCTKNYLQQLEKQRGRELDLGITLSGPHRDDLEILIGGKKARLFASEGQKKMAISFLKLAEWELLSERIGTQALIGFDDLESTLDLNRQMILETKLSSLGQAFVTSPNEKRKDQHHVIHL